MGENFTQIPNELFESSGLAPLEKLVWIVIKKHDWNGGGSWPSATLIAKESGLHRNTVLRIVSSCEAKGVVSVIRQQGRVNRYALSTSTTEQPVAENNQLRRSATQHQRSAGPAPEKCPNNTKEEDSIIRHSTLSRNDRIEASRKKAEEALDNLNLKPYREKYPTIDVALELQQCKDHHLSIQANFHGPKRRTDWGRVFHTWCRNAVKWNRNRGSPSPQSDWRQRFLEKEDS